MTPATGKLVLDRAIGASGGPAMAVCPKDFLRRRAALVVAHPAHELRLLGWLAAARPVVFALTDGRGRRNQPRIARTEQIVRSLGGACGSVFGDLTDAGLYEDLLAGRHDAVLRVVERLTEGFVAAGIDTVVVDAHEDAFLSHDVLNAAVRAAVLAASERTGRTIECYDYPLERDPRWCDASSADRAVWFRFNRTQLEQKIATCRAYEEVRVEVAEAFSAFGTDAFATECLRPIDDLDQIRRPAEKPVYESHGELMVSAGHYARVVRFDTHVLPLFERLASAAPLLSVA